MSHGKVIREVAEHTARSKHHTLDCECELVLMKHNVRARGMAEEGIERNLN